MWDNFVTHDVHQLSIEIDSKFQGSKFICVTKSETNM